MIGAERIDAQSTQRRDGEGATLHLAAEESWRCLARSIRLRERLDRSFRLKRGHIAHDGNHKPSVGIDGTCRC